MSKKFVVYKCNAFFDRFWRANDLEGKEKKKMRKGLMKAVAGVKVR